MKFRQLPAGLLFVLWSALLLVSCSKDSDSGYGSGGSDNPPPSGNTVSMNNMNFSVSKLEVKVGTTVTWTNDDYMDHTVTADDGSFSSGTMKQGDTYKYTFSRAGTFPYHCNFHPAMKASVVVS